MFRNALRGSKLGPYEILAPLGAGGMGEVYRANDTRLDRVVAIKVLPSHLSANPSRRERFEREARTVSSLNHPNICMLHDIGHQNGIDFLVLEYIEGETLAERLLKGALPLEQALRYAQQIAGALEKAHRHGIVHRDLKPGNIMITRTGAKLLDFGLAKAFTPSPQSLASSVSILQTEEAKNLTAEGTIIGTFQYMSPEQLEGNEADARSDIFSLGTVIYEMVTGKKPFTAKSPASLIAAILAMEPPPVTSIQTMAPPLLDYVVKKCLAKDPEDRWQSAQDLASQIQWILDQRSSPSAAVIVPAIEQHKKKFSIAWILAGIFFALTVFLLADRFLHHAKTSTVTQMSIIVPEDPTKAGDPVLSPDGRTLAFRSSSSDGPSFLWLRRFDATEPQLLRGTEGATLPFWSPDGRWLGFFAGGNLKKIEIAGGQIQTLCNAGDTALVRGGPWSSNGAILFASAALGVEGLYRVPATGGERTLATRLDLSTQEATHRWPHFLPDGRHFLYNIRGGKPENSGIYVGSLDSNDKKRILPDLFRVEYASDSVFFSATAA